MADHAPTGGYSFEEKDVYRKRLWSTIDQLCPGRRSSRRVVYLDTSEALERLKSERIDVINYDGTSSLYRRHR